ncbi:MAG: DUF2141 domain-containing protein [Pseudomonadota bacterium]|nr:DUF2141 domain-containing protein [Pseudomonadota bacterium]
MKHVIVALAAAMLVGAGAPKATLDVDVAGLRDSRGLVQACLSRDPRYFPDCSRDPASVKVSVSAAAPKLRFTGVEPGRYALSVFHDANANRRLDMLLGIPKEGFGFSRNPRVRFGAPKFEQVDIEVDPTVTRQSVRMQYIL